MRAIMKALWQDESDQDRTEYVLLAMIIVLGATIALVSLKEDIQGSLGQAAMLLGS